MMSKQAPPYTFHHIRLLPGHGHHTETSRVYIEEAKPSLGLVSIVFHSYPIDLGLEQQDLKPDEPYDGRKPPIARALSNIKNVKLLHKNQIHGNLQYVKISIKMKKKS